MIEAHQLTKRRTAASRDNEQRGLANPLPLARRLQNVHPHDQSGLEPVTVAELGVGDELARAGVVDHLMDIDRDPAVRLLGEALGLDIAGDLGELPGPVIANRRAAGYPTALPGVGPVHLGMHQLDRGSISPALNARYKDRRTSSASGMRPSSQ
jgi:hypothetical protein